MQLFQRNPSCQYLIQETIFRQQVVSLVFGEDADLLKEVVHFEVCIHFGSDTNWKSRALEKFEFLKIFCLALLLLIFPRFNHLKNIK